MILKLNYIFSLISSFRFIQKRKLSYCYLKLKHMYIYVSGLLGQAFLTSFTYGTLYLCRTKIFVQESFHPNTVISKYVSIYLYRYVSCMFIYIYIFEIDLYAGKRIFNKNRITRVFTTIIIIH